MQEIDQRGEVIRVLKKSGEEIPVTPFTWKFDRNDQESAKLTQYPLRLAYAKTIHKAKHRG